MESCFKFYAYQLVINILIFWFICSQHEAFSFRQKTLRKPRSQKGLTQQLLPEKQLQRLCTLLTSLEYDVRHLTVSRVDLSIAQKRVAKSW